MPLRLKTSVFRTNGLERHEIWALGAEHVAEPRGKALYGYADLFASDVRAADLDVVPEVKPHRRHANIVGWGTEKHERLAAAQELAARARLVVADER